MARTLLIDTATRRTKIPPAWRHLTGIPDHVRAGACLSTYPDRSGYRLANRAVILTAPLFSHLHLHRGKADLD